MDEWGGGIIQNKASEVTGEDADGDSRGGERKQKRKKEMEEEKKREEEQKEGREFAGC